MRDLAQGRRSRRPRARPRAAGPELHHAPPEREEPWQPRGSPVGSSSPDPSQQGHGGVTT
jgi:hypothetical protein